MKNTSAFTRPRRGPPAAYFHLGECYRKLGSLNSAKNSYQTLLSAFSTGDFVGPAAYRLADIHFAEKDYSAALPLYRKASVRVKDPAVVLAAKFYRARCLEDTEAALGRARDLRRHRRRPRGTILTARRAGFRSRRF